MLLTVFTFVILLSVLVLVHELGHFTAAKLAGIRVEEFGLGLPPRVWGQKIGETIYSINLLPVGGFVRLTGEEGLPETEAKTGTGSELDSGKSFGKDFAEAKKDPRSFASQTGWIKSGVLTAGVAMNFLLGVVLMSVVVFYLGVPRIEGGFLVQSVVKNSPAARAGLQSKDLIIGYGQIDDCQGLQDLGAPRSSCSRVEIDNTTAFVDFIKQNAGGPIVLLTQDLSETVKFFTLVPRKEPPPGEGALGIVFVPAPRITYQQVPLIKVPAAAFQESFKLAGLIVVGVKDTLVNLVTRGIVPSDVAGPVGVAKIAGDVARRGLFPTLQFAALLSINLGVINILPFPALDGGRLLFVVIEGVSGRKVHAKYQRFVHTIGILILLTLMLLITFYDILRFL